MDMHLKQKLEQELYRIKDDEEFVFAMLNWINHDEDRKELIEYIEQNENVSYTTLVLIGMAVYRKNNPDHNLEYEQ